MKHYSEYIIKSDLMRPLEYDYTTVELELLNHENKVVETITVSHKEYRGVRSKKKYENYTVKNINKNEKEYLKAVDKYNRDCDELQSKRNISNEMFIEDLVKELNSTRKIVEKAMQILSYINLDYVSLHDYINNEYGSEGLDFDETFFEVKISMLSNLVSILSKD